MKSYTTRDVAKLLGLSEAQVRSQARGYLAPDRGPRNAYRFSFQDLVLLRTASGWDIAASRLGSPDHSVVNFQRRIVEMMAERKCTLYHDAQTMSGEELPSTEAVAASPIFDHRDEVVGAVYGVPV